MQGAGSIKPEPVAPFDPNSIIEAIKAIEFVVNVPEQKQQPVNLEPQITVEGPTINMPPAPAPIAPTTTPRNGLRSVKFVMDSEGNIIGAQEVSDSVEVPEH